ncbi:HEAT repeat domain-containing protein [Flavitalea flava]
MTCKEIEPLLPDYLDHFEGRSFSLDDSINKISPESLDEIRTHLLTCEKCNRELEEMIQLGQLMDKDLPKEPSQVLRENFRDMLQAELKLQAKINIAWVSPVWKVAAVLIILLGGVWIGTLLKSPGGNAAPEQIVELRKEVKEMKEVLLFSLLSDESATQRIRAVSYAEEIANPDQKVIEALLNTLDHDKNVNVRLASLYSLARFSDRQAVRDSLVESLKKQTEPIIQVVLINILAEKKESKAIGPIREILSNKKTLQEVKEVAQKGLRTI